MTAATDMRVMVLAWREMGSLVGSDAALARRMLETMAKRVRQTERSLTQNFSSFPLLTTSCADFFATWA